MPRQHTTNTDETFREKYDWSSESPSIAVIEALERAGNRPADEIDPLYNAVDPDALNCLLSKFSGQHLRLSFTLDGFDVTISADGEIVARAVDP